MLAIVSSSVSYTNTVDVNIGEYLQRQSRGEYLGNNPLLAIGISTDNAQG
jgi:hypothetical protein